jgi:lipopolysaccharide transport protein LptA
MKEKILLKSKCYKKWLILLCLAAQTIFAASIFPQQSQDQTQSKGQEPTSFNADSAECTQEGNINVCTYIGHANFQQANDSIKAPKIIIYKKEDNAITQITADGNGDLARYHQDPPPGTPSKDREDKTVNASADVIKLYPDKNLVTLTGHAFIKKGKNQIQGAHIEYNTKANTIYSTPTPNTFTTIILQPKKND